MEQYAFLVSKSRVADFDDFSCYVDYGHVCSVKAPSILTPHVSHHRNKILDLPNASKFRRLPDENNQIGRQFMSDFPVLLTHIYGNITKIFRDVGYPNCYQWIPCHHPSEKPRGDFCVFFSMFFFGQR